MTARASLVIAGTLCAVGPAQDLRPLTLAEAASGAVDFGAVEREVLRPGPLGDLLYHEVSGQGVWRDPLRFVEVSAPSSSREPGWALRTATQLIAIRPGLDARPLGPRSLSWQGVSVAPNRRHLAFVAGGDLFVLDLDAPDTEPAPLTADGSDWVSSGFAGPFWRREVLRRDDGRAYRWSPDGAAIAFVRFDFERVEHHRVGAGVLAREPGRGAGVVAFPRPGTPLPRVGMGVAPAAGGPTRWVDLGVFGDEKIVADLGWSPAGRVVLQVLDRAQQTLWLCAADPAGGVPEVLLVERSPTWLEFLAPPVWLADGGFLWLSERTGIARIHHHAADGRELGVVTAQDWPVYDIAGAADGSVWFTSGGGDPTQVHLFRVGLDGRGLVKLTRGRGAHRIELGARGRWFLDRYSAAGRPLETRVCDAGGFAVARIGPAPVPALATHRLLPRRLLRIRNRRGEPLDIAVVRDEGAPGRAPVWLDVHGGPGSQTILDEWSYEPWHQYLAAEGFAVLQVNVRTAGGHGKAAADACRGRLGELECDDLEDACAWAAGQPWADPERIGITGASYGGFLVATALLRGGPFRLGVAVAGVYDWREYNAIYTERYLGPPAAGGAYDRCSPVHRAGALSGRLLLVHGDADRNVLLRQAVDFREALRGAGADCELVPVPGLDHADRLPPAVMAEIRAAMRDELGR